MEFKTRSRLFGITNQTEIARRLKTSQQSVSLWVTTGKFPPRRIIPFCEAVGYAVTPHQLDSVLYPNPTDALPVHQNLPLKDAREVNNDDHP
ncbi:Cro/Cl family transcriptional regulator [Salmonella enterica subsp. enterica serovar Muenchen]|nr:Cro/Cl family transcriptional regulator [Salmonella enterica subsp. enterica serovar Muenchen]